MKSRNQWKKQLLRRLEGSDDPLLLQPILELCGDRRIWIENHKGVKEYSLERICVAVAFGQLAICGSGLRLRRMQGQVLAITGRIDSITVMKGCS